MVLKVLIADDSDLVRRRLNGLISDVDGTQIVGEAASGLEALEVAAALEPDVVVLDIRMPGASGIEVLRRLKDGEAGPVVIVLTAYPYAPYRAKCLEAGAEYFFDKATEFEQVVEILEDLGRGGRAEVGAGW